MRISDWSSDVCSSDLAAKAKVFGLELEQTIAPTQHLSLQLNYAYVLPEYDSWSDPRSGADQSKTPFYFTPKHSGSATLSYTQPLGGDVEIGRASCRERVCQYV